MTVRCSSSWAATADIFVYCRALINDDEDVGHVLGHGGDSPRDDGEKGDRVCRGLGTPAAVAMSWTVVPA
jgi:hypothetical protein